MNKDLKKNFFFADFFIKSSKLLAVLILLGGMTAAVLIFGQWRQQLEEIKYKNNPELISSLQDLLRDYTFTKNKVLQLHSQLMSTEEENIELYVDPSIYQSYLEVEHFEDLEKQFQNIDKNSALFKKLIFKNFSSSVNFLLDRMHAYALSKKWVSEGPEEAVATEIGDKSGEEFSLISLSVEEFEHRRQTIIESLEYLDRLSHSVESEESQARIDSLIKHLNQYRNVMQKVTLDVVEESDSTTDESKRRKIFVIIDDLELMKKNINKLATSDWTLDEQYEKSLVLLNREFGNCRSAAVKRGEVNALNGTKLGVIAVFALMLSMSVLVLADLIKAILVFSLKS